MTNTPPDRYCTDHPTGTAEPCGGCLKARAAYQNWARNRAADQLTTAPSYVAEVLSEEVQEVRRKYAPDAGALEIARHEWSGALPPTEAQLIMRATRPQRATAQTAHVRQAVGMDAEGQRDDSEDARHGYHEATQAWSKLRRDGHRQLRPPSGAVCLDCGRPAGIAQLSMDGGTREVRCRECWAGDTTRARALAEAVNVKAAQYSPSVGIGD